MSRGCSYCERSGHSVDRCSERQEDYFGVPGDDDSEGSDDE